MIKILLDTDGGVDDILALLLLLRCPDMAEISGITTVAGNTHLEGCIENVRRGLGVAQHYSDGQTADGASIPLAAGASAPLVRDLFRAEYVHGPDGLGGVSLHTSATGDILYPPIPMELDPRPAWRMILEIAHANKGEVTIAAIGPLTNLALAFQADPEGFRCLKNIVLMGGAFRHDGNTTPRAEFNIYVDPEAAQIVLDSGVPVSMVPLDCSEQTRLMPGDVEGPGFVHGFVRDATRFIMDFHLQREGFRGSYHHDPCALAVALDPAFATGIQSRVMVERCGEYTTGETVAGLIPNRPTISGEPNATICLVPNVERFEAFFRNRVLPPGA